MLSEHKSAAGSAQRMRTDCTIRRQQRLRKVSEGWRLSGSDEGERSETKLLRRGVPPACAEECPAFSRTSKLS